ncbi:MAG: peptide deformylase [Planctomycetota bacterium]
MILHLGDPRLRWPCKEVTDARSADVRALGAHLFETLAELRTRHGFGRALAAPQVGRRIAVVAYDLGAGPRLMINPKITAQSEATFTLWDDCYSFPDLLVRVRRARSISLDYVDASGRHQSWKDLGEAESELFQHELDHLEGVLAIDRLVDADSVVTREEFARERERLLASVDHRAAHL